MDYKNSIFKSKYFRVVWETNKYVLGHEYENAYLYNKFSKDTIYLCNFYGDPECGVISDEGDWCVIGGDIIAVWKDGTIHLLDSEQMNNPFKMKIEDKSKVRVLTDPWSTDSAIWEINIEDLSYKKISDFPYYIEKPYKEDIEW